MTSYMMAATVESNSYLVSNYVMVAQDLANLIGAGIEALMVEFNQAAYEQFLQRFADSPKPVRSIRRIRTPSLL